MRREGKLLQLVRHRHVIKLYEIMETENSYYLVTELCQGGDLMDYICAKKKLDEIETKRFIKQIISAVHYLHRAGILHRDLKVENLLLDENKDIKIIDFGLSNTVHVSHPADGSSSEEYCVTQCGSPAYAAPELLGNKKYGHKVDIWSIGVNMFAMLTGNLPFTVEPFNIKTLHQKMLESKMNPLPHTLSNHGRDFINKLLRPDPEQRICLPEAMRHPWVLDSNNKPMEAAPFPNKLSADQLDSAILNHMAQKLDFRLGEVIRLVTANVPSHANATYQLFYQKLNRYNAEMRVQGNKTAMEGDLLSSSQSTQNTSGYASRDDVIDFLPLSNVGAAREKTGNRIADDVTKSDYVSKPTEKLPARLLGRDTTNTTLTLTEAGNQSTSRCEKKENKQIVFKINAETDRPATSLPKHMENSKISETASGNRAVSAWSSDKSDRKWSDRNIDRHKYAMKQSELPVIAEKPTSKDNTATARDRDHVTVNRDPGRYTYCPRGGATGQKETSYSGDGHVTNRLSAPSSGERKQQCWGNADTTTTKEPETEGASSVEKKQLVCTANNMATTQLRFSDNLEQRRLLRRRLPAEGGHIDHVTKRNSSHVYAVPSTHAPLLLPLDGSTLSPGRRLVNFVYPTGSKAANHLARNNHVYRSKMPAANSGSLNVTGSRTGVNRMRKGDDTMDKTRPFVDVATGHTHRGSVTSRYQTLSSTRKMTPPTSDGVSFPVIPPMFTPRGPH